MRALARARGDDARDQIGERRLDSLETGDTHAAIEKMFEYLRRPRRVAGNCAVDDEPAVESLPGVRETPNHPECLELRETAVIGVGRPNAIALFTKARLELGRGARGQNLSAIEHDDAIAEAECFIGIVSREEDRAALAVDELGPQKLT